MKIVLVLPCRAGSERVKNKNTRPFGGFGNGLLELKLKQILEVPIISKVIVSSNDAIVLDYVRGLNNKKLIALSRPNELGVSSTPMSDFIKYTAQLEEDGVMLMTHVTHPFVKAEDYKNIIKNYLEAISNGYDSLLTVTKMQKFLWDEKGPFNYDDRIEKWPRSQDIKPLYEVNHAAYMISFELAREIGDRVGYKPFMMELGESVAMDIDWEEQFTICEDIILSRINRGLDVFK